MLRTDGAKTGEGDGAIIEIESMVLRGHNGDVIGAKFALLMDYNCAGMYRAWIDDGGKPAMSI